MKNILLFSFILSSASLFAQKNAQVVFYNVENLFDTLDTPNQADEEYLPTAEKNWNSEKYWEKIAHINKVMNEFDNIALMGVCEIENKAVLDDVVKGQKQKLKIAHFESADERGIDVGLMYNKKIFCLKKKGILRFTLTVKGEPKATRDILYVELKHKKERIHVVVNHWPSRYGGAEESEPSRLLASETAKKYIDSVLTIDPQAKIIFMGDLNDYPSNKSVENIMEKLTPMITQTSGSKGGSHSYKNEWNILDHMLISPGMENTGGMQAITHSGKINEFEYLLETWKGNVVPLRTYVGSKYLGGYSDHLPVSFEIQF
jgi:endonuclease/exonuclease/phosphatase family metal-dependent hydrolase